MDRGTAGCQPGVVLCLVQESLALMTTPTDVGIPEIYKEN
jgi:hypothetical protein